MNSYDLDKTGVPSPLLMRRGDKGTTYQFQLLRNGSPFNLTNYKVTLEAKLSSGAVYSGSCTITNATQGKVSYGTSSNLTAVEGAAYPAYLVATNGSIRYTSSDLHLIILPDADLSASQLAQYKNRLAEINAEWAAIIDQVATKQLADGTVTAAKIATAAWVTIAEVDAIF